MTQTRKGEPKLTAQRSIITAIRSLPSSSPSSPRRLFSTSPSRHASPPPVSTPVYPSSDEAPLTAFQSRIAALETSLSAEPGSLDVEKHLELLKALLAEGEVAGLARWYEVLALGLDPEGGEGAGDKVIKGLVGDDRAWAVYVEALAKLGRLGEVAAKVRRRDWVVERLGHGLSLAGTPPASSESASTSPSTAPASTVTTSSDITASSPAPTSTASPLSTSLLSQITSPSSSSSSSSSAGTSPASASGTGTPLSPLYVQLAPPTSQFTPAKAFRWLLGAMFWAFILLTVFSMVMENTGLLKAGPGPVEFEAEEGKVVRFSDVHGCEEAKAELEEVVEFLRNPDKFSTLGGKLPKGVLLTGPPGTGKTMLARAVAGEAGVPFLFASGSQFDEMFVVTDEIAKRIRELFGSAKKKAPAIVFIDELDAIGSKRSAKDAHYMKQTLNQLLVELDGFEQMEGVIIIAATNFPESLDKALTRPGRFDRHVVVGLPDVRGRVAILKHHMGEVTYDVDVDPSVIARGCPGMSGADLQNLVNQAAVKASREGQTTVQLKHFEWAKADRILMGAERRSHFVTEESKRSTAYHEGGHALVALHTPGAMPLHKVTIMPRGQALGITFQLPEQDKDSYSRKEYSAMIDVALGGRAAEEMIFGHDDVTSGCSSDLQRATDVATRMIRSYGFSDKVGLVAHGDDESVYLSGKKKDEIEGEIRSFLDKGMGRVMGLLKEKEDELHTLAKALVEHETLSLDEVRTVLKGEKLDRPAVNQGEKLVGEKEKLAGDEPTGPVVDGI
ncbi:ATP-dependent peptidase [Dioszegia hungarica]|uniref:ATP-dependent peptidase n=1 Tax=Dioszegia hungarica TaxID=4972 RepID=A0AA38LRQ9_9TREE|nr:ATP-dependent peptidase [Dioszegia hungarica]KAI9633435.1 ATP-dependent peptidase [Dioszegia hungarica]